jgi:hypothetical protein
MKRVFDKLIIGLLIIIFSCDQIKDNSIQSDGNLPDSIRLIKALEKAEQYAYLNINSKNFRDTFETASDSSFILTTTIAIDSFFNKICLRVFRETPGAVYTDIYLEKENKFQKVLALDKQEMTYVKDTIFDVNGDKKEDYLVNWYGASGCCLKNFYDVYLFKDNGVFSEKYTFTNPTFSTDEKTIRGVCYGHPGETELYKYKWSDFVIDTIEYVYPARNEKGERIKGDYIKSKYLPWDKRNKKNNNVKLKSVPVEYKDIYGYDWFLGFE